ncbi:MULTISPECIES: hypothetical protein [Microbacterium]|uniref:Uncharacterized protein n=1 Tax=Microbacterium schleiferi TaxID=69362 RepID=A0ABU7V381_9MICO|nr:hypothetical protein [Microbacterium sp. 67-17]MBD3753615.1 hypothetical protein [Micrococcales bacterium]
MITPADSSAQAMVDAAPVPTDADLRRRTNLVVQFFRFIALGWGMFRLARH